jgi:hypothetical protein
VGNLFCSRSRILTEWARQCGRWGEQLCTPPDCAKVSEFGVRDKKRQNKELKELKERTETKEGVGGNKELKRVKWKK